MWLAGVAGVGRWWLCVAGGGVGGGSMWLVWLVGSGEVWWGPAWLVWLGLGV